jgi:hypothetical protein
VGVVVVEKLREADARLITEALAGFLLPNPASQAGYLVHSKGVPSSRSFLGPSKYSS